MKPKERLVLRQIPVQLGPCKAREAAGFLNTTPQRHRTELPSKREGGSHIQKVARRAPRLKAKAANSGFIPRPPGLLSYQHDLSPLEAMGPRACSNPEASPVTDNEALTDFLGPGVTVVALT